MASLFNFNFSGDNVRDVRTLPGLRAQFPPRADIPAPTVTTRRGAIKHPPLFQFHIDPKSIAKTNRKLEAMRLYVENIKGNSAPFKNIGQYMVDTIRKRTLGGRDIYGQPFAPLSTKDSVKRGEAARPRRGSNASGTGTTTRMLAARPDTLAKNSSYAARKARAVGASASRSARGKKALGPDVKPIPTGSVSPPKANLYLSGSMLNSLRYWASAQKGAKATVTIGVSRHKGLANILNQGRRNRPMPARPFIGLSDRERRIVTNKFAASIKVGLSKEILRTR